MPNWPLPTTMERSKGAPAIGPQSSIDQMFDALCTAAASGDDAASRGVAQAYRQSDAGQAFLSVWQVLNQQVARQ